MSKCVAAECRNEGWAAEPVLGAAFCFFHWDQAKASFFKDGFRLKNTRPYTDGKKMGHRDPKVYFLKSKGYIKIGNSMDPIARLKTFRQGIDGSAKPVDLDLEALECIGWILGDRSTEFGLHRRFSEYQVVGEWFRATPELETEIDGLLASKLVSA